MNKRFYVYNKHVFFVQDLKHPWVNISSRIKYCIHSLFKDAMTGQTLETFETNFTSQHRIGGKVPVSKSWVFLEIDTLAKSKGSTS